MQREEGKKIILDIILELNLSYVIRVQDGGVGRYLWGGDLEEIGVNL